METRRALVGSARRGYETRGQGPFGSYQSDPFSATAPNVAGNVGWQAGMVWRGSPPQSVVQPEEAMLLSAVFACLRLLSEAIATLPLDTFIRKAGIRKPYRPKPDYLTFQPPEMSKIDYLSQVMLSLLTDGNAYIITPRDELGVPLTLVVLDPAAVTVTTVRGKTVYKGTAPDGTTIPLEPDWDLVHIKGMCFPGAPTGLSPIGYARETIGLGLSAQRYGQGVFENGGTPGGLIEAPEKFGPEAQNRFLDGWNSRHRGVSNAGRVGVLTQGAKFNKVSMSPDEAQFLQTRAFQVPDVARIFGVPPHLIADASNSTSWGSGLAEQNSAFGQFSLRPWIERIEEGHSRLMTTHGMPDVFIKLNMDDLLRPDTQERISAGATAIDNQMITINEWRKGEDLPPVPWGDEPWVQKRVTETGPAPADLPGLGPDGTTIQPAPMMPAPPKPPVGAAK